MPKPTQTCKSTRRHFLRNSIVIGASALAVPTVLPHLLQAEVPANNRMGVMIVGAGGRGGDHARAMLEDPRTVILYICDPARDRAEALARRIADRQTVKPKVVDDMREALDDPALDIVTCASVNHWHTLCGIWALRHGKHVFLEKPISSTIHEGKAIVAAANKYDRICQVGTQRRSHTAFIDAVKFVQEGGIGDVKLVRGICYKRRKSIGALGKYDLPPGLNYDLWCGPAPKEPLTRPHFHYDWHWQRHCGNGEIGNNGPHFCDLSRWFLGIERFPDRIFSYGARVGYELERKNPNYVDAGDTPNTHVSVFEFGDKTIVMECRGLETPKQRGVDFGAVVVGSNGYLTCNGENDVVAFDKQGKEIQKFTGESRHYGEFLDAVEKNDKTMVKADARCGALSAALCHLGNIAYYVGESNKMAFDEIGKNLDDFGGNPIHGEIFKETKDYLNNNGIDTTKTLFALGDPLKINAEKEVFPDNAKANRLMKRDDREEFAVPNPDKV